VGWSKAYITTSEEEADKLIEVANAIPVNRSTKANPINRLCFLFILAEILKCGGFIYTLFLIYL